MGDFLRLRRGFATVLATIGFLGCLASAQAQPETEVVRTKGGFEINQGISGSWFNDATSGQGFLIDVAPIEQFMFVAWFTYEAASAKVGAPEQRWLVASGNYSGNRAELDLFVTSGGVFDDPLPVTSAQDGTVVLTFSDCGNGLVEYVLPSDGLQGQIPITRAVPGTEELCETLLGFEEPALISTVDDPANEVGRYTSIAIGADGLPVISYRDVTAGALKVAKCNDPACSGFDETITTVDGLDQADNVGIFSSIAIGADGLPVISYFDLDAVALKVAKCNDPACTGGDETVTTVDGSGVGLHTSIAIGADGLPVISYYDLNATALKVAKCNDPACSGGDETLTTVDNSADVGRDTAIAIGADGLPVISYFDLDATALKVAKCNDPACSGLDETITTVDDDASELGVGGGSSIAIGADGLPVISYADGITGALKVAKCNDPACSGGDEILTTVDNSADLGVFTSIAIGADGLPVISYRDRTASALKVAKCNDPACFGGDEIINTVDNTANDVGFFNTIAIGVDGLPVISYFDLTEGALRVAKCNNAACQ